MAKNSLYDLNDHLFERIEWLTDKDVKGADLDEEIKRSKAVSDIAAKIISNANLLLKAEIAADAAGGKMKRPLMIEAKGK